MRNKLFIAGLAATIVLPVLAGANAASAQDYDRACVRDNHKSNTAGTVLGGIAGALIGGAVAGHHDKGAGVAIGAVGGAVAGNAIARSNDHPCPPGYYYPAPPPAYGPPPPPPGGGFWYGAPGGIHERIDFMQRRIDDARATHRIRRYEADGLYRDLNDIRRQENDLRYRDGGHLNPPDRDYLQGRLDTLSRRIHWEAHGG